MHGLTEENQHVRLLQSERVYPSTHTKFEVGQIWDLELALARRRILPHVEDVIVRRWKLLGSELDLRAILLERVNPWRGAPDQLFEGHLTWTMNANKPFISEHLAFSPGSMGYWLPDAPLFERSDAEGYPCYLYSTPARELMITYTGFTPPLFKIPAQTLVHVTLSPWWTPSNKFAPNNDSKVERRCYLYIAGWYL